MSIIPAEKAIFSVSQLNRKAKQLLETHLPLIWVSGEISNLARPASGHWYFSLKDNTAQVRAAMFKNANMRVLWQPEAGQQVLVRARVSLYEGRGEYQLIIEHMEPAGTGQLQLAYEELKRKLQAEGLFDDDRKQELPLFPKHIGVITSPTGAAIRDILSVLKRRYPIAPVTVLPVAVQGEQAAPEMIRAITKAQKFNQFDLLIIGRGGGSLEDLWAFNNEELVRAIDACSIPVICAVGHEVDFTLCDFVADVRAATPSASAEIATPDLEEWILAMDAFEAQLIKATQQQISQQGRQVLHLQQRLRHPRQQLATQQQTLSNLKQRLVNQIQQVLQTKQSHVNTLEHRCQQQHPQKRIDDYSSRLKERHFRLLQSIKRDLTSQNRQLAQVVHLLNAVNPLGILSRGYSVTLNDKGEVIQSTNDVQIGDKVTTRLKEGELFSQVLEVSPKTSN